MCNTIGKRGACLSSVATCSCLSPVADVAARLPHDVQAILALEFYRFLYQAQQIQDTCDIERECLKLGLDEVLWLSKSAAGEAWRWLRWKPVSHVLGPCLSCFIC